MNSYSLPPSYAEHRLYGDIAYSHSITSKLSLAILSIRQLNLCSWRSYAALMSNISKFCHGTKYWSYWLSHGYRKDGGSYGSSPYVLMVRGCKYSLVGPISEQVAANCHLHSEAYNEPCLTILVPFFHNSKREGENNWSLASTTTTINMEHRYLP